MIMIFSFPEGPVVLLTAKPRSLLCRHSSQLSTGFLFQTVPKGKREDKFLVEAQVQYVWG